MRIVIAVLAFSAITAPAAAQSTTTATPHKAGKGTRFHTELDASQPPVSGRLPRETVLSVQTGYRFDGRAIAKRCTAAQAEQDACPAKSAIGSATVTANYMGSPVVVPISLFLSKTHQPGDVAGFFAVATILESPYAAPGRVVRSMETPFGLSVILTTPGGDGVGSLPATFESFESDIGASRVIKKGKRRVRRSLITNPATCTADSWASRAQFTFGDGSTATLDAPIACVP